MSSTKSGYRLRGGSTTEGVWKRRVEKKDVVRSPQGRLRNTKRGVDREKMPRAKKKQKATKKKKKPPNEAWGGRGEHKMKRFRGRIAMTAETHGSKSEKRISEPYKIQRGTPRVIDGDKKGEKACATREFFGAQDRRHERQDRNRRVPKFYTGSSNSCVQFL